MTNESRFGKPGEPGQPGLPSGMGGAGGKGGMGGTAESYDEAIRELNRRLSAIEIVGSPNMRERVSKLEGRIDHITDPESGVYTKLNQSTERLRTWAVVLLTALVLNMGLVLLHMLVGDKIP